MKLIEAFATAKQFAHMAKLCGWPDDVSESILMVCDALIKVTKDRELVVKDVKDLIKENDRLQHTINELRQTNST